MSGATYKLDCGCVVDRKTDHLVSQCPPHDKACRETSERWAAEHHWEQDSREERT